MKSVIILFLMILSFSLMGQWTQLNDIPFINHHTNGYGINGKAYIIQGEPTDNSGQNQNQLWEYDPDQDSWNTLGFVPGPSRALAIGDDMDGKYYFGFGIDRNDLWEFDPVDTSFTELPICPCEKRGHPAFVAHKNKIYMGSGSANGTDLKDWWVFDFETQMWEQKEDIPGPNRHHPFQFGIDDAIYVGGGHDASWLRFDIESETWSSFNDQPLGRVAGSQFSYNGKGFVISGDRQDHWPLQDNQFLVYYPTSDEWHDLPFEASMHRWAPSSFIIEDELYFFGGYGGNGGSDSHVWKFDLSSLNCVSPQNLYPLFLEENSVGLFWENSPSGDADTLQWRVLGETEWNNILNPQATQVIEGLESCTEYEYRVNSNCGPESVFSEPVTFRTKGCGYCLDLEYCDLSENYEGLNCYISSVKINGYENNSGNEMYQEYSSSNVVEIEQGASLDIEVIPTITAIPEPDMYYRIWIDLNADGTFNENEIVLDASEIDGALMDNILIPEDAKVGLTRMRISMSLEPLKEACLENDNLDGETEDYCFVITEGETTNTSNFTLDSQAFTFYPNPANQKLWINNKENRRFTISIHNLTGEVIYQGSNTEHIDLTAFRSGLFIITVEDLSANIHFSKKLVIQK